MTESVHDELLRISDELGKTEYLGAAQAMVRAAREINRLEKDLLGTNVMLQIAARPSATHQISEERMHALLVEGVENCGSQKAWALASDVSPQYVNDCIRRHKPIGISISLAFGYVPVTVYVPMTTEMIYKELQSHG